jgi:hypothetical protein
MRMMKTSNPETSCFYCGAKTTDVEQLPFHHIFGKANSPVGVLVCKNCHHNLLHDPLQKQLPKIVRKQDAPPTIRALNGLLLWSKHLQRLGEEGERLARQAIQEEVSKNGNSVREDDGQEEKSRQTKNQQC